jgi:glycosyltransferase involved in cell wall biosynthesis
MTIGIAIPTYNNHILHLKGLLDMISKSTVLPKQVSVSISSFNEDLIFDEYPFELIITKTSEYKNPSQNRNIAAKKLSTDIISFIDGDDLPHIKRNEYILKSFELGSDVLSHNYNILTNNNNPTLDDIGEFEFLPKYINKYIAETHAPENDTLHLDYHNAHISLLSRVYEKFEYDENENFKYKEDSEFNSRLVKNGYKICYLKNKLSYYRH